LKKDNSLWFWWSTLTKYLDAIIAGIRHEDISGSVQCQAIWIKELSVPASLGSPFAEEYSGGSEYLYATIAGIRHEDISGSVHCQGTWILELSVPVSLGSPFAKEYSSGSKFLDAIVVCVCYEDISKSVRCDASWGLKIPWLRKRRPVSLKLKFWRSGISIMHGAKAEDYQRYSQYLRWLDCFHAGRCAALDLPHDRPRILLE
jgi:hypothetical protein